MKRTTTSVAIVALAALLFTASAQAQGTMQQILESGTIDIGVAPWTGMYVYNETTGEYEGVIADDVQHFEKVTDLDVNVHKTSWGGLVAGLVSGKWDVIMNGLGATLPRARAVSFTIPIGYYAEAALVRTSDNVESFDELDKKGNVLTAVAGSSAATLWNGKLEHAELKTFSDSVTGMLEVIQGRAKAYMSDMLVNTFRARKRPKLELFIPDDTKWYYQAYAVRPEDTRLLNYLNTYIRTMRLRGWYKQLSEKWDMPEGWVTGPK